MNLILLNIESQKFINSHLNSNITELILKGHLLEGIDSKQVIEQIESKKRSQKKLPTWFNHPFIYYPNKLNIEQTSSELTAVYKATLITGNYVIDLTGGFGVDCWAFSKNFKSVTHCEINEDLSKIAAYNFERLNIENIECVTSDGISFLETSDKKYDWIYVDPSRRHDSKGKVFFLQDCLPNIPKDLNMLLERSENIMLKTSPLLDLSIGIGELKNVKYIHVVAVNNEVKELLWILEKDFESNISVKTINLKSYGNETFSFKLSEGAQVDAKLSLPKKYLYEPNAAIMKGGGFNEIAVQLPVYKLHKHSHLYTSEHLIEFPGRQFNLLKVLLYHKKSIKKLAINKANITTRNFPESVDQIRKKFNIADGGSTYLFFTTDMDNKKIVLICAKVT